MLRISEYWYVLTHRNSISYFLCVWILFWKFAYPLVSCSFSTKVGDFWHIGSQTFCSNHITASKTLDLLGTAWSSILEYLKIKICKISFEWFKQSSVNQYNIRFWGISDTKSLHQKIWFLSTQHYARGFCPAFWQFYTQLWFRTFFKIWYVYILYCSLLKLIQKNQLVYFFQEFEIVCKYNFGTSIW